MHEAGIKIHLLLRKHPSCRRGGKEKKKKMHYINIDLIKTHNFCLMHFYIWRAFNAVKEYHF
jgi:hypothetical protein